MHKMKRIKLFTALLLAAAMVLPMAGCGKGKPKDGGEASPASCAAAGEYEVYSMTTAGTTLTRSQLQAGGMAEGMFLKINADGTGEINYTGSQTNAIKVDEKAGKVNIEGGAELDYALEGGRITLTFPGNSLIMVSIAAFSLASPLQKYSTANLSTWLLSTMAYTWG